MKNVPIILAFAFLFFGCGDSRRQPLEKADRLTEQAVTEMNKQKYEEAERLLVESIEIHTQANNEAKLAENYSTLSTVQLLSGKLSPALETLTALRGIYQHGADRNAELQTLLQIGKIYFQLGRTEEAFAIFIETYNNSKLFRLDQFAIISAIELSALYSRVGKNEKALVYATNGYQLSLSQKNLSKMVEALNIRIYSLAVMGNISKAFELFRETETIVLSDRSLSAPNFYVESGKAFARAEEWSFAKGNYERAVSLIGQARNTDQMFTLIQAKIGIAELYFHHFAFSEAQQQFVQAYNLAKDGPDGIIQSYLLVRVADCLTKRSAYIESQDGIIRATQLYEQAQTLFSRSGFPFGEAIALHRLGMLKEMTNDDNAAITFYKRAYDKYSDHSIDPRLFSLPISIETLCQSESKEYVPIEWFSKDLLSLLLKYKRTNEAFSYLQSVRSISLQSRLTPLALHFKDPLKNIRYSMLQRSILMRQQNLLELHQMSLIHQQTKNRNYVYKLQQQISYTKSKALSEAVTLAQEFPAFSFLAVSQSSFHGNTLGAIPSGQAVLDFILSNNEAWVFIARSAEELSVVKISSYGYALEKKMNRYCELLYSLSTETGELQRLGQELYESLIKPIDLSGIQKVIIIPPFQFERFPFHTLSDNGVFLIEKTGVSYLPHSAFIKSTATLPKFINAVAAFGFTPNSRWGLEFELRDIRSFFSNSQANINQTATDERLASSAGEVLQISSNFMIDADNDAWFTLSDGSTSKAGINVPISRFTDLHPFQIVYLSDVQSTTNNITALHPLLWLLNGSVSVITTQFPITSNISKTFGENFYSSLVSEMNPYLAYNRGIIRLGKNKELSNGFGGSAYFYYGVQ